MDYIKPEYAVTIVTPDKTRYYVKQMGQADNLVLGLELSEPDRQLAQKAVIKLANLNIPGPKGGYPRNLFKVRSRVFVYAKGAGKTKGEEVFRGFIWETRYSRSAEWVMELTCYDNLIYLMNSEISMFFAKGKSTKFIVSSVCGKWGIRYKYSYPSITHPKLPLSGSLADVLTSDVLDKVKKKKGTEYVVRSVKDVVHIMAVGKNSTVYQIDRAGRGIQMDFTRTISMDDMVTKVIVAGKTDKKGKTKIEATLRKNTKEYGTLQKVIHKDEDTKLKEAKAEAKELLKEHANPDVQFSVRSLDIPWIRKGDRVQICFGASMTDCMVKAITHHATEGTMELEVRKA